MTGAAPARAMAERRFVSRGGDKLDGALRALGIDVAGLRALDAGAATGGFTDCLLARGARQVVAVDVAYGEFAWTLRNDPRVRLLERTNVRTLDPAAVEGPVDLVVADLSFISLRAVAGALTAVVAPEGTILVMVKPQFELPRASVPRGGVVTDPRGWTEAMRAVADAFRALGWNPAGAAPSMHPGPKGNREFFVCFRRDGGDGGDGLFDAAAEAAP